MKSSCVKEGEFIPLNFDMVFKKVFGDPNNVELFRKLIKAVLDIEILRAKYYNIFFNNC